MSVLKINLSSMACALLFTAGANAQSDDRSWEGFYGGIHLGGVYGDFTNSVPAFPGPTGDAGSGIGGVQLGHNWRSGDTVFGAEIDFSYMELRASSAGGSMEENFTGSLRFRAGQLIGETLVYGSLGVAWTQMESGFTGLPTSTDYEPGLIVGGGAERWLRDGVTGRVEAFYVDVPTSTQTVTGGTIRGGSNNLVFRAGLNLHF